MQHLSWPRCNLASASGHGESCHIGARRALEHRVDLQVQIPSLIFTAHVTLSQSWGAVAPECPHL